MTHEANFDFSFKFNETKFRNFCYKIVFNLFYKNKKVSYKKLSY